jgi:hypothetical protein
VHHCNTVKDAAWAAAEVGPAHVSSLDWADPSCYAAFQPPYDFILAADCVYSELAGGWMMWQAGKCRLLLVGLPDVVGCCMLWVLSG